MSKNFVILFVFLLGFSTSNAQYLEFNDFIKLLDIAEERVEVEKFLEFEGFSFTSFEYIIDDDDDEDDTTHYQIDYHKKLINGEYYYIKVLLDTEEDHYTVTEYSENEDRSFYFASILAEAELEPVDEWKKSDGYEGFSFESDDYYMIISKKPVDGEMQYRFTISAY